MKIAIAFSVFSLLLACVVPCSVADAVRVRGSSSSTKKQATNGRVLYPPTGTAKSGRRDLAANGGRHLGMMGKMSMSNKKHFKLYFEFLQVLASTLFLVRPRLSMITGTETVSATKWDGSG